MAKFYLFWLYKNTFFLGGGFLSNQTGKEESVFLEFLWNPPLSTHYLGKTVLMCTF